MGLIRNHYVGRTFIQPQQSIRHFGVKVKLNPVRSILEGKRVVLVDDSIVRGTTSRKIVRMVKAAGAREVHMRISCPPTISPCFYGVDTPSRNELIAATHTIEEIEKYVGADSLRYLEPRGTSAIGGLRTQLVLHVVLHRDTIRSRSLATKSTISNWPSSSTPSRRRNVFARLFRIVVICATCAPLAEVHAQDRGPAQTAATELQTAIDRLGDLDYEIRSGAARTVRRTASAQAVPALLEAAVRAPGWVRAVPGARAARRIRRSANQGSDGTGRGGSQRSAAGSRIRVL